MSEHEPHHETSEKQTEPSNFALLHELTKALLPERVEEIIAIAEKRAEYIVDANDSELTDVLTYAYTLRDIHNLS